jgi:hypothetical protein
LVLFFKKEQSSFLGVGLMRYAEFALLLIPIVILGAWVYGIRGLSLRGVLAFLLLFSVIGATLYFFGAHRVFSGSYVPAHLEGWRVVPGLPK